MKGASSENISPVSVNFAFFYGNAQEVPAQALSPQGYKLAHRVKGGMVY
jgi:hypothetical protein